MEVRNFGIDVVSIAPSEMFGEMFFNHVIPSFFNNDKEKILYNSRITLNGNLTPRFSYLIDYIND